MKKTKQSGFTLIELLVVIAIIGILTAVVLASLNAARGKGADAAVKSDLDNMRAQAEISYDTNNQTYSNVCTDSSVISALNNAASVEALTGASLGVWGGTNTNAIGCTSSVGAWITWANLPKGAGVGQWWCADNTGSSRQESVTGNGLTTCP